MLRKALFVALGAVCLVPAAAMADANMPAGQGMFEMTIGGSGVNSSRFNGVSANGVASVGVYLDPAYQSLEVSIRQSLSYTDVGVPGKVLNGSTRVAVDLHFPMGTGGNIVPFVGANIGYVYGDSIRDTWEAAPEAGIKYYINASTFIYGMAEYQFFFRHGGDVSSGFADGEFVYTVGVGFRM